MIKKRKKYKMITLNGVRCKIHYLKIDGVRVAGIIAKWSESCSGCTEVPEMTCPVPGWRGMGCHECGYTGRTRR